MDEKDELYSKHWQLSLLLQKLEQKKEGGNNLCFFLSKQFNTLNVQVAPPYFIFL
jgi:hypothetical protein